MTTNSELIEKIFMVRLLLDKVGNETIFKKFNISSSIYGPLKMISNGLSNISEMKKYTTETPSSLTQKINKLESLGLVSRKQHPQDKRKSNVHVTKKGSAMIEKIDTESNKHACIFDAFSKQEKEGFEKVLTHLEQTLITNIKNHYEKH